MYMEHHIYLTSMFGKCVVYIDANYTCVQSDHIYLASLLNMKMIDVI
jgi:hypothetical protein